jgi:hypothetical protein
LFQDSLWRRLALRAGRRRAGDDRERILGGLCGGPPLERRDVSNGGGHVGQCSN